MSPEEEVLVLRPIAAAATKNLAAHIETLQVLVGLVRMYDLTTEDLARASDLGRRLQLESTC